MHRWFYWDLFSRHSLAPVKGIRDVLAFSSGADINSVKYSESLLPPSDLLDTRDMHVNITSVLVEASAPNLRRAVGSAAKSKKQTSKLFHTFFHSYLMITSCTLSCRAYPCIFEAQRPRRSRRCCVSASDTGWICGEGSSVRADEPLLLPIFSVARLTFPWAGLGLGRGQARASSHASLTQSLNHPSFVYLDSLVSPFCITQLINLSYRLLLSCCCSSRRYTFSPFLLWFDALTAALFALPCCFSIFQSQGRIV